MGTLDDADWLKSRLREAFAPVADERVPQPLLELARQVEAAVARQTEKEDAA